MAIERMAFLKQERRGIDESHNVRPTEWAYLAGIIDAKRAQAELLIEFAATIKTTGVKGHTDDVRLLRMEMAARSTKLNAKGVQIVDIS